MSSRKSWQSVAFLMMVDLGVAGCATPTSTPITPVEKHGSVARPGEDLASVALARVAFNIERGKVIGIYETGGSRTNCMSEYPATWKGDKKSFSDDVFSTRFGEALRNADYTVAGDSSQLFEDLTSNAIEPEYLVGARIDAIEMDLCESWNAAYNYGDIRERGSAGVTVTWQVYSTLEQKVMYETQSRGAATRDEFADDGIVNLIDDAFAAAASNLAADQGFHDLLLQKPSRKTAVSPPTGTPILVEAAAPFAGPIAANTQAIEQSTVTIQAGVGQGSGFFIAPDLVITNYHVAGHSKQVKLILSDGTTIDGDVLRGHPGRDVALIKVNSAQYRYLPIRLRPLNIAEDVYAIGTPLDQRFAGTVTRGIVSQLKPNKQGLLMIQADASIQHGSSGGPLLDAQGNVTGIAVAMYAPGADDTSVGLNFFIPIADALKYLNVSVQ